MSGPQPPELRSPRWRQAPPAPPPRWTSPAPVVRPTHPLATLAFIFGLLGLVLFWVPVVGLGLALLGFVFGWSVSRTLRATSGIGGRSLATAGWILSLVGGPLGLVGTAIIVTVVGFRFFSGLTG
ncbi:MAG: hypothetical protein WAM30_13720 [Candidatus Dormiibacterota bacterium]